MNSVGGSVWVMANDDGEKVRRHRVRGHHSHIVSFVSCCLFFLLTLKDLVA